MPVLRYRDPETGEIKTVGSPPDAIAAQGHIDNKNNPHEVTAEQVGAAPVDHNHDDKYATIEDLVGAGIPVTSDPEEGVTTWIDPDEEGDEGWYTKEEVDALFEENKVTPEEIGAAKKSTIVNTTLLAANWTGDAVPYTYTLTVNGITVTSNQEFIPGLGITLEELTALQGLNTVDGGQAANTATILAFGTKPSIDIPIRVVLRGDG